jgi:hypothetical protein
MTNPKQTDPIRTRLTVEDRLKFEQTCTAAGLTEAELARKAIREMLDRQDQGIRAEVRDELAEEVRQLQEVVKTLLLQQKKTENRMAALMARNNIDIGIVYQILWFRTDPKDREEMFKEARVNAVRRASKKLKEGDLEVKELMKNEISS